MIPKKIQIKNFLSYGAEIQTIDFSSYNLICLSGKNGHGKSALLDAMTWALWGQARKTTGTSKADEGLVHIGQNHMLVIFDFEINNEHYRIRREFVKTKSTPFSALDFGIVKDNETFTALTDKTIKATQTKLEKTIGITYESFINSAFLRQGQANEFSKKSPKERKEILATILQLEKFEDLKKLALEKHKTLQLTIIQKQNIQERINKEKEELTQSLHEITLSLDQLKTLKLQEKQVQEILNTQLAIKHTLQAQEKEYEFLQLQIKELIKQQQEINIHINQIQQIYDQINNEKADLAHIKNIEFEHKKLVHAIAIHQEKLNKRLDLKDQYLALQEKKQILELALSQEKTELNQQYHINHKILEDQIEQTQSLIHHQVDKDKKMFREIQETETTCLNLEKEIKNNLKITQLLDAEEKLIAEKKALYETLKLQGTQLNQQIHDLSIKSQMTHQKDNPSCPLCEQNLSTSRKKFLENKYIQEQQAALKALQTIKDKAITLQEEIVIHSKTIESYKNKHEALQKMILIHEETQKQLNKLQDAYLLQQKDLITYHTTFKELHVKIKENEYNQKNLEKSSSFQEKEQNYQTLIKKIDALKQTAQKLSYNKDQHEHDYKALQEIESKLTYYQKIQQELQEQEERSLRIKNLKEQYYKLDESIIFHRKALDKIKDIPEKISLLVQEITDQEQMLQNIKEQESLLISQKAIADLQNTKLLKLQKELVGIEKEIDSIHQEIIDFSEIIKALGKDGLQALLIEEALPEIEQEANILLAQLTENQTQIYIESLRDLKKGGSKETLDIKISDSVGLRPYEMFSGGEAFRIDFALRIAISKLLARRAGTSLQTLIIDEGFGSQDDDGLQLIMDSILKIQNNFAMVIIVSHLPSMKEQFPVQFLVQKKSSGSIVHIIEQD